jgi:hypothetical protein
MPTPDNGDVARQIRHVRDALKSEYEGLIDVSDVTHGENPEGQWLSRALAAKAVQHLSGCTAEEAAATVIDGRDDYGVDAVAISPHACAV